VSVNTAYRANFIETTYVVHQIQRSNFRVHFLKWTCSCALNIFTNNKLTVAALHSFLSTVQTFLWWVLVTHSVFKLVVQNVHQLPAIHDRSLLRNDTIALSINFHGKSYPTVNEAVFSSVMLVIFVVYLWYSIPALRLIQNDPVAYPSGAFTVILRQSRSLITRSLRKTHF